MEKTREVKNATCGRELFPLVCIPSFEVILKKRGWTWHHVFFSLQGVSILKPTIHGESSHPLRSNSFPYIVCSSTSPHVFFPPNYGSGIAPYGFSPLNFLLIRIMAVIFHSCSSSLTCPIPSLFGIFLYIYHGYQTKL